MQLIEQYISSIKGKLAHLVFYVQISNGGGLFDINTIAEDFYCKLLSQIYDYKNLQNLNEGKKNVAAIDLGDRYSKTSYQITSEDSTTKVHESIKGFIKRNHNVEYNRLIVLIITSKSSHPRVNYDTEGHFSFDKDNDIKDITDLFIDIKRLHTSNVKKLEEIDAFLSSAFDLVNSTKELTNCPNLAIEKILGREEDILELQKKTNEATVPILLKGIGGIGKSSLAKVFLQLYRFKYNNLVWVNAASGIYAGFVYDKILLENLNIEFKESHQIEDRFHIVVNKLRNLPGKGLLIIDNALIDLALEIESIPYASGWTVLITSRIQFDQFEPYVLKSLSDKSAMEFFYKNYSIEKNDAILLRILNYIDNHTLTIELLSKTANKRKLTLAVLNEQLIKNGLNIESKVKVIMDNSSQSLEYAFNYLVKIFDISEIEEVGKKILRHFSVIATDLLTFSELEELFPTNQSEKDNFWEEVEELVIKGWLSKDLENNYNIHPVIQEVARYKLNPTVENCSWVIYSLRQIKFINHAKAYVDYFLKNDADFREEKSSLINLSTCIADIFYSNNDYKNANKYQLKAILFFEKIMDSGHYELSFLLYDYFKYLSKSSDFSEKALLVQQRAFDITKHHKENLGYNLSIDEYIIFYQNRAEVCISLGLLSEANQLLGEIDKLVKKISEKEFESKKGALLNTLGRLSLLKEDNEGALKYQLEAIQILEKQLPMLESFSVILNNLAGSYFRLRMIEDALKITNKNIQFIKSNEFSLEYLAKAYNTMALILSESKDLEGSMDYQNKAIDILSELLGENHCDVATNLSNKGFIYSKLGKYIDALYCQKKALKIRLGSLPPQSIIISESYYWLALCSLDLDNLDDALKYIQESLSILAIYPQQEILSKLISTYEKLSFILYQKNEIAGAISALNEAIKLSSYDMKYSEKSLELGNILAIISKY